MGRNLPRFFPVFISLVLLGLYLITGPTTIQTGDTSELVASSFFLRVAHPPGYPLWTLLYHLPLKFFGFSTPYHIASVLTSILGVTSFYLLIRKFKDLTSILMVLSVFTSTLFWKYSVLPDVFMLHVFFIVLLFLSFYDPEKLESPVNILLISLSIANHHTILFVFPLYLYCLLNKPTKKIWIQSLIFGFVSLSLYLLLMLFHPGEYGSWGNIRSVTDVVNHFLRKEYGTFQLHLNVKDPDSWFIFFFDHLVRNGWALIIALITMVILNKEKIYSEKKRMLFLGGSILWYLVAFTFLAQVKFENESVSVFERFLIQPFLLFGFIVLLILNKASVPRWLNLLFVVQILFNISTNFDHLNYRKNTSINDYVRNSFKLVDEHGIFFPYGDDLGFGSYYLHDVEKIRPDVILMLPTWGFRKDFDKFETKYPGILKGRSKDTLLNFDLSDRKFFTTFTITSVPIDLSAGLQGFLFEVSARNGSNDTFNCPDEKFYDFTLRPDLDSFSYFDSSRIYELNYGLCHFSKALSEITSNDFSKAKVSLEKATLLSPFNVKYWERLCFVKKQLLDPTLGQCISHLDELLSQIDRHYYFLKR